jgi:glycosyltransferase involved in cell wall biosynthesis
MSKIDKEIHQLRIDNQQLQEEVDRLFNRNDVFRRLVNVFILRPLKKITKHTYRILHEYDANYQTDKFKPYVLKTSSKPVGQATNVLHIINNFKTGGASRIVVDLIEGLPTKYNHTVVTRYNPIPQNYEGVNVMEFCDEMTKSQVHQLLDSVNPQLIHVHWGTMWSTEDSTWQWYYSLFKVFESRSIPIVQNVNLPVVPYFFKDAVVDYIFVSDYVLTKYGGLNMRNSVIYPGSDLSFFERQEVHSVGKNIGMVYRLDDHKLKQSSIDPFIIAAQLDKEIMVHIIGDGALKRVYENKVKMAGLESQFNFYSYVPYNDLPGIYEKLDLFIAPVFEESFGQVTPFAMSMRLPVLGYDTGALIEIIGDSDCLVDCGEAEKLAQLIVEKLAHADWIIAKGKENMERAKLFSLEQMIHNYSKLYEHSLVGNNIK